MSSLAPVDILEEDAADLQFPKDTDTPIIDIVASECTQRTIQHYRIRSDPNDNPFSTHKCAYCKSHLTEPYINCAECWKMFCLSCFAKGAEVPNHFNSHPYIIRHDNIKVFPMSTWSAKEDKRLLGLIQLHGYGNWDEIGKGMHTKSGEECRDHYTKNYFGGIFERTLGLSNEPYVPLTIPYLYKMKVIEPPRPELDSINFKTMAGYRCARGDFDTPYDNSAETIVSSLDLSTDWSDESQLCIDEMNCAIFNAYNHRLRERKRRYKIMREHGLLATHRTLSWLSKHADALGCEQTNGNSLRLGGSAGRFISFMQLTSGITFDSIVESMQHAHDMKKYVFRLYELRKNGITTFYSGKLYHKLKSRRLSKIRDKKAEQYDSTWDWKQLIPNDVTSQNGGLLPNHLLLSNPPTKRKSLPLDILGLPSYEKLTEDEKQLCSRVRIVPSAYLSYKGLLMAENSKIGYLRLREARRLIKIDVNKTRQIYDFLLKSGFVNKPFS